MADSDSVLEGILVLIYPPTLLAEKECQTKILLSEYSAMEHGQDIRILNIMKPLTISKVKIFVAKT